jgi:hypothetical protein
MGRLGVAGSEHVESTLMSSVQEMGDNAVIAIVSSPKNKIINDRILCTIGR